MLVLIKINISSKTRGDFSQQGWNIYYRGGVIALHFSHNPPRTIKTPMVSFAAGRDKTMATPACYASGVRMGWVCVSQTDFRDFYFVIRLV